MKTVKEQNLSANQIAVFNRSNEREFTKQFWAEKVSWKNQGDVTDYGNKTVRINGEHFVVGEENVTQMKGHGGRQFTIEFLNGAHKGQVITTTNLWHQGDVPSSLKTVLPDNARFVPTKQENFISQLIIDSTEEVTD
jgi:hypothetical protein